MIKMVRDCLKFTSRRNLTRWLSPVILLLCLTALATSALGWGTAPTQVDNPNNPESFKHAKDVRQPGRYSPGPHAYIVEHAANILNNDGHTNWGAGVYHYHQALLDGLLWPDNSGPDLNINLTLWSMVPFPFKANTWSFRICNESSLNHYYNPDTNKGLQLSYWQDLANIASQEAPVLSWLGAGLVGLDGLAFTTVDISPSIKQLYDSAADLCEQYYQKALQAWRGQIPAEKGRGVDETAMFYLGGALHHLSDVAVVTHNYDSFMGNHDDFEGFASGKGDLAKYHATSGGFYNNKLTPGEFVKLTAKAAHTYQQFQWVEGNGASTQPGSDLQRTIHGTGPTSYDSALAAALPATERYSAGLLAKFFSEIQIPGQRPPLTGYVLDSNKNPIAGAYVFFKSTYGGIWAEWEFVRTDQKGKYVLNPGVTDIQVRPAMPGYDFDGGYVITKVSSGAGEKWGKQSPVPYSFPQFAQTSDILTFTLKQLPLEVSVAAISQVGKVASRATASRAERTRVRPRDAEAPSERLLQIQSMTSLVASQDLAERIAEASLQVLDVTSNVLRVQDSDGTQPYSGLVMFQVNHIVDLNMGVLMQSPAQITQSVQKARGVLTKSLSGTAPKVPIAGKNQPDPALIKGMKLVDAALPLKMRTTSTGELQAMLVVPSDRPNHALKSTMIGHGLIPIPAPAGVEIEGTILPGSGYLGSTFTQPLRLVTDAKGRAAFKLISGTHAGRINVQIKVTKDPFIKYVSPSALVEFIVHPRSEADVSPLKHPDIEAAKTWTLPEEERQPKGTTKIIKPLPKPQIRPSGPVPPHADMLTTNIARITQKSQNINVIVGNTAIIKAIRGNQITIHAVNDSRKITNITVDNASIFKVGQQVDIIGNQLTIRRITPTEKAAPIRQQVR